VVASHPAAKHGECECGEEGRLWCRSSHWSSRARTPPLGHTSRDRDGSSSAAFAGSLVVDVDAGGPGGRGRKVPGQSRQGHTLIKGAHWGVCRHGRA
jgi:hypothetical protein